jgi:2-dehydropantoate 2-reductase
MKIAVFGAGAIGSFYAGRLIQAGQEVSIVARGRTRDTLAQKGLRIDDSKGTSQIEVPRVVVDPREVGTVDLVLVAVKAWQVPEVAPALKPLVGYETLVLPLQNGVEAADQLSRSLGGEHVLNGMTKVIVRALSPGHIEDMGFEPLIAAGQSSGEPPASLLRIQQVFEAAGVRFEVPHDIQTMVWEKFLFIASVSGVGAVTRSTIGVLRRLSETRELLELSMAETFKIARTKGVELSEQIVADTMRFVDSLPEDSTASLQRDIMAGRPSELESQNGAVVRLGLELGVDTPIHRFIYYALLPMELAARGE